MVHSLLPKRPLRMPVLFVSLSARSQQSPVDRSHLTRVGVPGPGEQLPKAANPARRTARREGAERAHAMKLRLFRLAGLRAGLAVLPLPIQLALVKGYQSEGYNVMYLEAHPGAHPHPRCGGEIRTGGPACTPPERCCFHTHYDGSIWDQTSEVWLQGFHTRAMPEGG
jgi:hypothetical protein